MSDRIEDTFSGYVRYRGGEGQTAFLLHRFSGLATLAFLVLHILTISTVFFAPAWYNVIAALFRNPFIMAAEIVLAFFVVFHGVNGLRIAYFDCYHPELWAKIPGKQSMRAVFVIAFILWLPALWVMGWALLTHGLGLFGGGA